jgi:MFS transporter, putative metabolite transport protein
VSGSGGQFSDGYILGIVGVTLGSAASERGLTRLWIATLGAAVAWAAGYGVAYCVGFALRGLGSDAWRWMLLGSAIPAALISPLRAGIPESPLWRQRSPSANRLSSWTLLFSEGMRQRSLVACLFYTCQVIPFFALSTFIPLVLTALNVHDGYSGGLVYSVCLLAGAGFGLTVVDRLPRRVFLVGSFYACALVLTTLTLWNSGGPLVAVGLFAVFSAILAAAANLLS